MKIHDISMPVHEAMPVYGNDPAKHPSLTRVRSFPVDGFNESAIAMDLHTGTHIDAPFHMVDGGATLDLLDLSRLLRRCKVLDLTGVKGCITRDDLTSLDIQPDDFLLLKTANSYTDVFSNDFVFLALDAAKYLAEKGIAGVGVDGLGVERNQTGHPTHKVLMGHGVLILEGLRLEDVPAGEYGMVALPIRIVGTDAAPARVVLIEGSCGTPTGAPVSPWTR